MLSHLSLAGTGHRLEADTEDVYCMRKERRVEGGREEGRSISRGYF